MDRRIGAKDFGAAMRAAKRLGEDEVAVVKACAAAEANASNGGALLDVVLYAIGERDLMASFVTDLAKESGNAAMLAALGQLAVQHNDAHAMLLIGKTALARGLAMDPCAFPEIGAVIQSDRFSTRSLHRLLGRAHGKRFRSTRHIAG
jgi:soluble lytic murein transglycosylase